MEVVHAIMFVLVIGPFVMGGYGYFHSKKIPITKEENENSNFSTRALVINSAVLYALAYNLVFFIQELFLALGKKWLGLKAYLYHNNHGWDGEHPMTALAQGYGALAIFIAGWIFLGLFFWQRKSGHWTKLFLLWLSFQSFIQSLPQVFTAPVAPQTDVAQAFNYLEVSNLGLNILTFLSGISIILVCIALTRFLLEFAPDTFWTSHPKKRFGYMYRIAILASILGVVLIIPFRILPWHQAAAPFFLALNTIPWIFTNAWRVQDVNFTDNEVNNKILILPIILLLVLLGIFQLILAPGLVF